METKKRTIISVIGTEPIRVGYEPEGMTETQLALRHAIVNRFTSNKIKRYITEQLTYINCKQHIAEGLKILFDERGNPPANAPVVEIVEARERLEGHVKMFESICAALNCQIAQIKEIEHAAFELLAQNQAKC